ncbi:MAG: HAD-IA family hydrolase [Dehalococcoidia bacterium]|nr:HAD-IA family hydrolase [Dehalococcoidia bacterium]
MPSRPELLLFDLGGVLVEFSGVEDIVPWLRETTAENVAEEAIRQHWASCDLLREFEFGRISASDFAAGFVEEWGLTLSPAGFLTQFESWTKRLYPGARELLEGLRPTYRLAALSNSNELHWRRNEALLGVQALFERAFSSHETGFRKPDPAAFRFALEALEIDPGAVVFFDDVEANVKAARDLGISAEQVVGVEGLREGISKLGLLK